MTLPSLPIRPRYSSIKPRSIHTDQTPSRTPTKHIGKDVLVFCDGTAKDGDHAKGEPTNVWRLYKMAKEPVAFPGWSAIGDGDSEVRRKEILYIPGVGSGSVVKNPLNLLARLFGATIVESIVTAYLHIASHYQTGDSIYLFGYSRGAFVARKVACLIYRIGLVTDRDALYKLWYQHEKPVPWEQPTSRSQGANIPIKCLGVWDTVGAVYMKSSSTMESDILGMENEELPPNVQHALHAVAFHENRKLFRVTLLNPNKRTELKEIWFPGAHSDVGGGGGERTGLPNISLLWMIGEIEKFLNVRHDELEYPELGELKPTDAYHSSPPWKRIMDKCETRLESGVLNSKSLLHTTFRNMQNMLSVALDPRPRSPQYILTVADLCAIGWNMVNIVSYNAFEMMKHSSRIQKKRMQQEYRQRVASLLPSSSSSHSRTPRLSAATLAPSSSQMSNPPRQTTYSTRLNDPRRDQASLVSTSTRSRSSSHRPRHLDSETSTINQRLLPASPLHEMGRPAVGGIEGFREERRHRTSRPPAIDPRLLPAYNHTKKNLDGRTRNNRIEEGVESSY